MTERVVQGELAMRRVFALVLAISILSVLPGRAAPTSSVVERNVSFSVRNTNTTRTAATCKPDGKRYMVRGVLAGPEAALSDGPSDAVTLYLHGSGDGSSWNFTGFPDVDHIGGMAELGHVSVFIHMIGYGTSDAADGSKICYGSFSDVAHQVVQHLRHGTYTVEGASPIAFERIALAGHSGGAVAVELYSVSYEDIDALIVAGWADVAVTFIPLFEKAASFALGCGSGGRSKAPGGPKGWGRIFSKSDLRKLLYNMDEAVFNAFAARYEDDACGIINDVGAALASSIALSPLLVKIPVLTIDGDHDPFAPGSFELQRARYVSSSDSSLAVLPNAGHNAMHGRTAPEYRAVMSGWLNARGF